MIFRGDSKLKSATDEQLMALMEGKQKADAITVLFNRYHQRMYDYMTFMLFGNTGKAQDFVQDLFLKVIEKANTFNTSAEFRPWLYTLARNMCRNERRNQSNRARLSAVYLPAVAQWISEDSAEKTERKLLWEQIVSETAQLDEITKTTFLLRYQQQLPVAQIAEIMECPEGTVKSRLHNISKKLASKLNPERDNKRE